MEHIPVTKYAKYANAILLRRLNSAEAGLRACLMIASDPERIASEDGGQL